MTTFVRSPRGASARAGAEPMAGDQPRLVLVETTAQIKAEFADAFEVFGDHTVTYEIPGRVLTEPFESFVNALAFELFETA